MTSKRKTTKKKLSLVEFRAWLSGVEEMQSTGWVPSDVQWKLIRDKIDLIVEIQQQQAQPQRQPQHQPQRQPQPQHQPQRHPQPHQQRQSQLQPAEQPPVDIGKHIAGIDTTNKPYESPFN